MRMIDVCVDSLYLGKTDIQRLATGSAWLKR